MFQWCNGALVPAGTPVVAADDTGLTVGLGAFTTVLVDSNRPVALAPHLDRLLGSLERLEIAAPDRAYVERGVAELLRADQPGTCRLRVTITGGRPGGEPTVLVTHGPLPVRAAQATLVTCPWPVATAGPLVGVKSTSYAASMLAVADAQRRGGDEALLLDGAGLVVEGSASNIVVELGGELVTPPLDSGCLPGVTRQLLIDLLAVTSPVVERPIRAADLASASGMLLTSSLRGVQIVRSLDGQQLPVGELTAKAHAAYQVAREQELW